MENGRLTLILKASPYSGQTAGTALALGLAALAAGRPTTIFGTADGTYGFVRGQRTAGVFDVGRAAEAFLAGGGAVEL